MPKESKTKKRPLHNEFAILKKIQDVELIKENITPDKIKKEKPVIFSLLDFVNQNYQADKGSPKLKVTIKDIGIAPFEIDIYGVVITLVEVTGKMRNDAPERIYKSRHHSIEGVLIEIGKLVSNRKLQALPTANITLADYHKSYSAYWKYIASVIKPEYGRALDKLQDNFPFIKMTKEHDIEEHGWFKED